MSDDRQRFEEYLAKFEECYQSIEVARDGSARPLLPTTERPPLTERRSATILPLNGPEFGRHGRNPLSNSHIEWGY